MFGLIYSLFVSVGCVIHKANQCKENEENKIKYRHPDGLTYVDIKGQSRLLTNNELVFYMTEPNGDYVLKNMSGHIYKNFSAEKRSKELQERFNQALKNNESTYCIDKNKHEKDWTRKGRRFKDFETGDIYIIRWINYKYYYMKLDNGMLVRKTDYQIAYDEKCETKGLWNFKDLDIVAFNEKQKTVTDQYSLYREWEYNYYCNIYK